MKTSPYPWLWKIFFGSFSLNPRNIFQIRARKNIFQTWACGRDSTPIVFVNTVPYAISRHTKRLGAILPAGGRHLWPRTRYSRFSVEDIFKISSKYLPGQPAPKSSGPESTLHTSSELYKIRLIDVSVAPYNIIALCYLSQEDIWAVPGRYFGRSKYLPII